MQQMIHRMAVLVVPDVHLAVLWIKRPQVTEWSGVRISAADLGEQFGEIRCDSHNNCILAAQKLSGECSVSRSNVSSETTALSTAKAAYLPLWLVATAALPQAFQPSRPSNRPT